MRLSLKMGKYEFYTIMSGCKEHMGGYKLNLYK